MERITFDDLPEDVRDALQMLHIPGQDETESIAMLHKITAAYPGLVPARLNLAAMQLQTGDVDGADATYRAVLADFSNDAGATAGLATVHAARMEFDRAEQLAQQAIDSGYQWPPLYEVIGEARENAGDIQAASDAYLASYRQSPHSWQCLAHYCRLNGRTFLPPLDAVPSPVDNDALKALFRYIDETAHTPTENGEIPGCDHTFRFTEQWAEKNDVDIIELYQFLNAHGGFCDCEVCFNVESSLFENEFDDEEE